MKKRIALAAAILLLLSVFAGCSGDTAEGGEIETEAAASTEAAPVTIVGTWKYTLDYRRLIEATLQGAAESGDRTYFLNTLYDGLSDLVILELREDGTFVMNADAAVRQDNRRQLEGRLNNNLPDLVASYLGTTLEELETRLAEEGLAVDEASMNAWAAQYVEVFDVRGFLDSVPLDAAVEGAYAYDDGYLYLMPASGALFLMPEGTDTAVCITELSGSELKITDVTGELDAGVRGLVPLVFVRQGE